jgi:hypothetical protein
VVFAGAVGLAAYAIVGASVPRAMEPCNPTALLPLFGTLVEVRQGDTIVPSEQAVLEGIPRQLCVTPDSSSIVNVADCDFPAFSVNVVPAP